MTITDEETKESPTYSERMEEPFPDINEEQEAYREEQQLAAQKYIAKYFAMIKALQIHRTHHVRINSWKRPEPHRADGSPLTKQSRRRRTEASHKRSRAARLARRVNR